MKKTILILALIVSQIIPPALASASNAGWETVGTGIEYRKFHFTDPRPMDIFVTRMDRSNFEVTIDTGIAQGRLSGGIETVLGMANRHEQTINFWGQTWGQRNQVVVAINGYYFNNQTTPIGVPWSGQIHSGWYAKRYDDYDGNAGFTWTMDRETFIADCVYHRSSKQKIWFENSDYNPNLHATNILREDENLILYTPQYDSSTGTTSTSAEPILEILIEMTRPTSVLPTPAKAIGNIRKIRDQQGSTQIPFDHVVLTAWGPVRDTLLNRISLGEISVGDSIGISQEITDCPESPYNDWSNAYAGLGGDYHFINDGVIRTNFSNPDAFTPNSRTAVAYNAAYVYFIVVDRWNPGVSEGITIPELADFVKNTLGATDAVAQDSGGSSTMVINSEVVNNTDCNFSDCRGSGDDPENSIPSLIEEISPEIFVNTEEQLYGMRSGPNEINVAPLVANSMMMVVVQKEYRSSSFEPGNYAIPRIDTPIRSGPGTNYASIGTAHQDEFGVFQEHGNQLNGVAATGSYWWKASYGGVTGWVKEDDLYGGRPVLEADFAATPVEGVEPLTVEFTNQSVGDYDELIWDFGDGITTTVANPTHVFSTAGHYPVTLTISRAEWSDQNQAIIRVLSETYQVFLPVISKFHSSDQTIFIPLVLR